MEQFTERFIHKHISDRTAVAVSVAYVIVVILRFVFVAFRMKFQPPYRNYLHCLQCQLTLDIYSSDGL